VAASGAAAAAAAAAGAATGRWRGRLKVGSSNHSTSPSIKAKLVKLKLTRKLSLEVAPTTFNYVT